MVKTTHNLNKKRIEKRIKDDVSFLLTNKAGGYFSSGLNSRYGGLFFKIGNRLLKIIDEIKVEGRVTGITNNFWSVERKRDKLIEGFFMPLYTNTLVYELNKHAYIDLLLDVKEPYDNREWGRNYEIFVEKKKIIVKFTKKSDWRNGEEDGKKEYTIYLVIEGNEDLHYKKVGEWARKEYDFDKNRGSFPFERHVYNAMKLVSKRIVFSVSESKNKAIENAERILHNLDKLKEMQKKYHHLNLKHIKNKEINVAFKCAVNSLDGLLIKDKKDIGIYAGLPWFFQFWSRDETISLKALILEGEFDVVKKILLRQLKSIALDGRLPNSFPSTETGSADAIGWHFKRWYDLIDILSKKGLLQKYFDKKEMKRITNRLKTSLSLEVKNHTEDDLGMNGDKETWMDSIYRPGSRIEIQALRLNMYKLMFILTKNQSYKKMEDEMRNKVKEKFWNSQNDSSKELGNSSNFPSDQYLADGTKDPTIRPNIFIAAYIYPKLLTKKEWETCFENILPKLWLDWGGLSTIDKTNPYFCDIYTGEEPKSYHNGDSWFWINNLAALVLSRTNKRKFKKYIDKIIKASTKEILWKGMIGHHTELSSAKKLRSEGCLSQAWSSAMYIELIDEFMVIGKERK